MLSITRAYADEHGQAPTTSHHCRFGTVEVRATGQTRSFGPGDVLLVEDTTGVGHSSRSSEGFVGAVVQLEPSQVGP